MKSKSLLLILLFPTLLIFAQRRPGNSITGKVLEKGSDIPMEYANIILFNAEDSTQVSGASSNEEGLFNISPVRPAKYYLELSFIGFNTLTVDDIVITRGTSVDLGELYLESTAFTTDDIVVSESRAPISYEIDKKVINVSEQITALSGSAVDVLENVPSITVDIEGNVSLRGSGNFRVLVDGRPTIMESNDVLQQMPASSIENIEIITNPSAKYDPEGTAGIINLVLKKNKNIGYSGIAEISTGWRDKYRGQLLGDYKTEDYSFTLGLDYSDRNYFMDEEENNRTTFQGITSYRNSFGESDRSRKGFGLRGELGINLSDADYLVIGGRYRDRQFGSHSAQNYSEWKEIDENKFLSNSNSIRSREGDNYSAYISYDHKFNTNGHLLKAEFQYEKGNGDELTVNELLDESFNILSGRQSFENGPDTDLETRIEYTLPLGQKTKFEAGYQNEIENSDEVTGIRDFDLALNSYISQPLFDKDVKYKKNEHAAYSMFSSEWENLGYQFGLRTEYTDREIELSKTNEKFVIDRVDFFPSLHTSYKINTEHELMASYTRRIDRPRGWALEPFETWIDAYNVRVGNPALKPEYIDSYELAYQALLGGLVFSLENYYRVNHNKIERIRSVYGENITLSTSDNVGTDYSYGSELMFNFDPIDNWNINLMGNLYNYRIEGEIDNETFSRESFNWNTRFNNSIKFSQSTQLQLNLMYNSPSVSAQGERTGFLMTNIAVRQDFLDKMLSATLQVRDIFGTAKHEHTSEALNYYNYRYVERESPMVMLNLRFSLNRQGRDRDRGEQGGGMDNGGGDEF